jgi:hypothetical protein
MRTAALTTSSGGTSIAPWARRRSDATTARERARRHVVGVVLLVYLLLIFEGSIRKWLVPQFSLYVFFIRDPFVLYAYFLAFQYGLWPKRSNLLWAIGGLAALGLVVGLGAMVTSGAGDGALVLTVYGWRNYFFYAPLAFLIGATFLEEDLRRILRWTLILAVPVGVLVAMQFFSPPGSPVNVGSAEDAALQFSGIALDALHTRPMGTFSSQATQAQFVATSFAALLAFFIMPRRARKTSLALLVPAACGVATCIALGGSRGALLHCALIAVVGMSLAVVGRTAALKMRAVALPVVLAVAFAVLYPIIFPEGFRAFTTRWETAAAAESRVGGIFGRALYDLHDFTRLIEGTPVVGYGLGMGGNAATTLGLNQSASVAIPYTESDWARHIVDLGPIFGVLYILLRIVLILWLAIVVLRATRRGAGPWPLLLFAYVWLVLLSGQITGQGGINGYVWLFAGLTIAASAPGRVAAQRQRASRSTTSAPSNARR